MSPHLPTERPLADRLREHVETLAGPIGERNVWRADALAAAAEHIERTWCGQGHEVASQSFEAARVTCRNLEIEIRGTERPRDVLLIGAHYDTVRGSPGADDNASGVAALLEIGGALVAARPAGTIRLVAFVNEEPPFFYGEQMGSRVYARAARLRGDRIRLMISLEMLGYYDPRPGSQGYPPLLRHFFPDRGTFVGFVSNLSSRRELARAVQAFRSVSDFPVESLSTFWFVPGVAWSDQLSFWREGFRALMVTDTAFYRNPRYHTASDTPDTFDYASMASVTEALAKSTLLLANG